MIRAVTFILFPAKLPHCYKLNTNTNVYFQNNNIIPDGIRTRNLKIRSLAPYPLGHGDLDMYE